MNGGSKREQAPMTQTMKLAAYLVTGDRKLRAIGVFQGVKILSPRASLTALEGR